MFNGWTVYTLLGMTTIHRLLSWISNHIKESVIRGNQQRMETFLFTYCMMSKNLFGKPISAAESSSGGKG